MDGGSGTFCTPVLNTQGGLPMVFWHDPTRVRSQAAAMRGSTTSRAPNSGSYIGANSAAASHHRAGFMKHTVDSQSRPVKSAHWWMCRVCLHHKSWLKQEDKCHYFHSLEMNIDVFTPHPYIISMEAFSSLVTFSNPHTGLWQSFIQVRKNVVKNCS